MYIYIVPNEGEEEWFVGFRLFAMLLRIHNGTVRYTKLPSRNRDSSRAKGNVDLKHCTRARARAKDRKYRLRIKFPVTEGGEIYSITWVRFLPLLLPA